MSIARDKIKSAKRARKQAEQQASKGKSRYARKHAFLKANGGRGTDWPDKPWR